VLADGVYLTFSGTVCKVLIESLDLHHQRMESLTPK